MPTPPVAPPYAMADETRVVDLPEPGGGDDEAVLRACVDGLFTHAGQTKAAIKEAIRSLARLSMAIDGDPFHPKLIGALTYLEQYLAEVGDAASEYAYALHASKEHLIYPDDEGD